MSSASIAGCGTRSYRPPVHMFKLTEAQEITPYVWVHPDDERQVQFISSGQSVFFKPQKPLRSRVLRQALQP